jgi:hypothetical protein
MTVPHTPEFTSPGKAGKKHFYREDMVKSVAYITMSSNISYISCAFQDCKDFANISLSPQLTGF